MEQLRFAYSVINCIFLSVFKIHPYRRKPFYFLVFLFVFEIKGRCILGGMERGAEGGGSGKVSNSDVSGALKKCLEENKGGDDGKCRGKIEALKSSSPKMKPVTPLRLRSGSLTDV